MGPRDGEGQEGWKMLGTVRVDQGETYFLDLQPEGGQRSYCFMETTGLCACFRLVGT